MGSDRVCRAGSGRERAPAGRARAAQKRVQPTTLSTHKRTFHATPNPHHRWAARGGSAATHTEARRSLSAGCEQVSVFLRVGAAAVRFLSGGQAPPRVKRVDRLPTTHATTTTPETQPHTRPLCWLRFAHPPSHGRHHTTQRAAPSAPQRGGATTPHAAVVAVVADGAPDSAPPIPLDVSVLTGSSDGAWTPPVPATRAAGRAPPAPLAPTLPPVASAATPPSTLHVTVDAAALAAACPAWRDALAAAAPVARSGGDSDGGAPAVTLRVPARLVTAAVAVLRVVHDARDVAGGADGAEQVGGEEEGGQACASQNGQKVKNRITEPQHLPLASLLSSCCSTC